MSPLQFRGHLLYQLALFAVCLIAVRITRPLYALLFYHYSFREDELESSWIRHCHKNDECLVNERDPVAVSSLAPAGDADELRRAANPPLSPNLASLLRFEFPPDVVFAADGGDAPSPHIKRVAVDEVDDTHVDIDALIRDRYYSGIQKQSDDSSRHPRNTVTDDTTPIKEQPNIFPLPESDEEVKLKVERTIRAHLYHLPLDDAPAPEERERRGGDGTFVEDLEVQHGVERAIDAHLGNQQHGEPAQLSRRHSRVVPINPVLQHHGADDIDAVDILDFPSSQGGSSTASGRQRLPPPPLAPSAAGLQSRIAASFLVLHSYDATLEDAPSGRSDTGVNRTISLEAFNRLSGRRPSAGDDDEDSSEQQMPNPRHPAACEDSMYFPAPIKTHYVEGAVVCIIWIGICLSALFLFVIPSPICDFNPWSLLWVVLADICIGETLHVVGVALYRIISSSSNTVFSELHPALRDTRPHLYPPARREARTQPNQDVW